jgi:hypothetical protein
VVAPEATATTTTKTRVIGATIRRAWMPILYRCPHRPTVIVKKTRGYQEPWGFAACFHGGAQAPLSNCHFKQLSHEIAVAQPSANRPRLKWSSNKLGFDEEDHSISTKAVGTIPIMCTPTINNIAVNCTLIDGGAGLNIIFVKVFEKMQVSYIGSCQPSRSLG